ncbi:hypothetical protein TTHERM_000198019 (macronuclear) [Tetrahymena thermophila SB210]|uniref:Transmembrane protein n=1 Tax=Tetrahymena thermophila (strain SB210) TaxID=312017 RepID=W7XHC9_TETTS|nr:hypothetical protein TTHERM_000198019 [Tetrahymena thermophila SB210]EWS76628.1 hypothetical protein TTHERM_000198019 [Tetrahymena thermophila SB210]|eukprot:XP_012650796.1 hypothetical protein TTHERM_000198019 [Tetrahymena thermophila SB210]
MPLFLLLLLFPQFLFQFNQLMIWLLFGSNISQLNKQIVQINKAYQLFVLQKPQYFNTKFVQQDLKIQSFYLDFNKQFIVLIYLTFKSLMILLKKQQPFSKMQSFKVYIYIRNPKLPIQKQQIQFIFQIFRINMFIVLI